MAEQTTGTAAAGAAAASTKDVGAAAAGTADKAAAGSASATQDVGQDKSTASAGGNGSDKSGVWPSDWATRMSKGDEKVAKQFSRYASPEALAEAHISLRRRFDSGEFRAALPKDAKPEEVSAWRKDNGIPEKPEAYDLKGLEIPEGDKEIIGS